MIEQPEVKIKQAREVKRVSITLKKGDNKTEKLVLN